MGDHHYKLEIQHESTSTVRSENGCDKNIKYNTLALAKGIDSSKASILIILERPE